MKYITLAILLLFTINTATLAGGIKCIGMTPYGKTMNLISDLDTGTVNLNGDIFKVVGTAINGKGIVTENYVNADGTVVYLSLQPLKHNDRRTLNLYLFNGVTNQLLSNIKLSCGSY